MFNRQKVCTVYDNNPRNEAWCRQSRGHEIYLMYRGSDDASNRLDSRSHRSYAPSSKPSPCWGEAAKDSHRLIDVGRIFTLYQTWFEDWWCLRDNLEISSENAKLHVFTSTNLSKNWWKGRVPGNMETFYLRVKTHRFPYLSDRSIDRSIYLSLEMPWLNKYIYIYLPMYLSNVKFTLSNSPF